ncbi:MAG: hypothetical protein IIA67_14015 [Planctomycetes bacterium]|nr:hypothetical protein [Planctomycetota bacterium]
MTTNEKIKEFATQLLEKSRANEVNWRAFKAKIYLVRFPSSALLVWFCVPTTEPDYVSIQILNDQGERVAEWSVYETDDDWNLAHGLYLDAERCVKGWDETLADVEKALSTDGPVGVPIVDAHAGDFSIRDADIPF